MEDSGFCSTTNEQRLLVRVPCNTARSSPCRTPPRRALRRPRQTLNLSPKRVPNKYAAHAKRRRRFRVVKQFRVSPRPDAHRTCERGIKSATGPAAGRCYGLQDAEVRTSRRCNEQPPTAACGDDAVLRSVLHKSQRATAPLNFLAGAADLTGARTASSGRPASARDPGRRGS